MAERDEKILQHIGLYRVSLRVVVEKLFFKNESCDHVLQRLLERERVQAFEGLPGGISYYQLTRSETARKQLPKHAANPRGPSALREALAVLWFCCMKDRQRSKLDRSRSNNLFGKGRGDSAFGKPFCVERTGPDAVTFYRVYVPGPGRDDQLFTALRKDADRCIANSQIARWILAKAFSFAILLEDEERMNRLRSKLLANDDLAVPVHLELVPAPHTLADTIREHREKRTVTQ